MAANGATIEQVKEKYEHRWLALEGVEGVGIGEDRAGRPALKVYLSGKTEAVRRELPHEVEGYAVVTEDSGEFHILPA